MASSLLLPTSTSTSTTTLPLKLKPCLSTAVTTFISTTLSSPSPSPSPYPLLSLISVLPPNHPSILPLHALSLKLFPSNLHLSTSLLHFYSRSALPFRTLSLFRHLQAHHNLDHVSAIAAASAISLLGSFPLALWLHRFAQDRNFLNRHVRLNNALIDMYFKCGAPEFARQVFEGMSVRTRVSWNSMVVGLAANGRSDEALKVFDEMLQDGFKPDGVTFTGAMTACSHAGLVEEGLRYYDVMRRVYKVVRRIEHYGCLVDLLGRAGRIEEAMAVVERMPLRPNVVVLGSLLAACRAHGEVENGERVMKWIVDMEEEKGGSEGNYVLLSNIYAAVGRWDNVGLVRSKMKSLGIRKKPGSSVVEVDGTMFRFVSCDKSHPRANDILGVLELLKHEMTVSLDDNDCESIVYEDGFLP